uniref:Mmp1 protein n=1 Tax=Schmidtea mediterranea TaxID=79327 RepID=K0JBS3_SCHMD|nr:mmp1 protein [Schmidtea mediterranea]
MKLAIVLLSTLFFLSVHSFKSSEEKDAEKYLTEFYDYDKSTGSLKDSLKDLQKMAGIEADGKLSDEVISHMNKGRCGGKDKDKKSKRYVAANARWDRGVTYKYYLHLDWMPRTMSEAEVRRAIQVALDYWVRVSNLGFAASRDKAGCMFSVSFSGRDHLQYDVNKNFQPSKDPYPLDNVPSGVLAHAFFPRNGNLHYDNAETWTEGKDSGINLRIVTAHEMGHAIGLHHSNDPSALMAPWYGGYISEADYRLPNDDTLGAQSLYGARGKRALPLKKRDLGKLQSRLCNAKNYDGVFAFSDDKTYVIADGSNLFRLDGTNVDETFEPVEINEALKNADSMFYDKVNKRLVVFKGDKVYSASGSDVKTLKVEEMKIGGHGAYLGKSSAAFARQVSAEEGMQYFWLIQDNEVISGEVLKNKIVFSRRTRPLSEVITMSNGAKFPPSIDAALLSGEKDNLQLYLFVGNSYYVGKPTGRKQFQYSISADYPKSYKQVLKC